MLLFYLEFYSPGQLSATAPGETQYFTNSLSASQEVPATTSAATGSVTVLLDKTTNQVYVTGNFHNLAAAANAAHLHRGLTGVAGPVIVPLSATADTSGTITGSATVSASFADSMVRGFTYANIHDAINPGGEIRTQLGDLVLPVTLQYFNGYKDNGHVVLIWQSAQETGVRNYEVEEQNTETGEWIRKAIVTATGGNAAAKYRSDDIPFTGKTDYVLYRLKTIDFGGKALYSSVIKINFSKSKAVLSVTPNPAVNGRLVVTVTGLASEQKAEISIIDFSGRTMLKSNVSTLSNNPVNISKLSAGMYKLVVRMSDTVLQESFSKQ